MTPIDPDVAAGMIASLCTGIATGIGALPVLGIRRCSANGQLPLLAFAGGVMLAASVFSLIVPAVAEARAQGYSGPMAMALVGAAVVLGAVLLAGAGRVLPFPETTADGADAQALRPMWMMIAAITLHNIPEGAAVGMSFAPGSAAGGWSTAVGIGVQNLPEGLAVACAFLAAGFRARSAFWGGVASGAVEPIAGAASAVLVHSARALLPWGLALAAGAMLLIVFFQLLPELVRHAREAPRRDARFSRPMTSFATGLILMCCLDVFLA